MRSLALHGNPLKRLNRSKILNAPSDRVLEYFRSRGDGEEEEAGQQIKPSGTTERRPAAAKSGAAQNKKKDILARSNARRRGEKI